MVKSVWLRAGFPCDMSVGWDFDQVEEDANEIKAGAEDKKIY